MTRRGAVRRVALARIAVLATLMSGCATTPDGSSAGDATDDTSVGAGTIGRTVDQGSDAAGDGLAERPFADDSPWNTELHGKVDPRSGEMIRLAEERVSVTESDGSSALHVHRRVVTAGLYINTEAWTTPVVVGGEPTTMTCRQIDCGDEVPGQTLDVPADVDPMPQYDGWFSVVDGRTVYDFWRARRETDGSISYQFSRAWDLDGPGYGQPGTTSARGSGLPLIAGLIEPEEIAEGRIEHALAISVPGPAQRSYVSPASSSNGNGQRASLPEGARIRLRADVVLRPPLDPRTGEPLPLSAQQRRAADALVAALRRYGAIVVDRAAVPTLYASPDVDPALLLGPELQGLTLDDFEVMELPGRHADRTGVLP